MFVYITHARAHTYINIVNPILYAPTLFVTLKSKAVVHGHIFI